MANNSNALLYTLDAIPTSARVIECKMECNVGFFLLWPTLTASCLLKLVLENDYLKREKKR